MSGLGDAHTHLSWNGGDLQRTGALHIEEHILLTARSSRCYLDSGYTMSVATTSLNLFRHNDLSNMTSTFLGAYVQRLQRIDWILLFAMLSTQVIFGVQDISLVPMTLLVVMEISWLALQPMPMDQRK